METVEYICEQITQQQIDIGLPVTVIKELLLKCTMNVQFLFNGNLFRQIDGVAMGSPLGPFLADIFVSKLENGILKNKISNFKTYVRYMDDTLIICDSTSRIDNIIDDFNRAHRSITFTCEVEQNNSISFLDAHLTRRPDGSISRSIHRKPTWVGQYTHFQSFVPLRYKRNLIKCLVSRANRICTDDCLPHELELIRNTLRENGYPDRFISKNMKHKIQIQPSMTVSRKPLYLKLRFKGEIMSEKVTQKLRTAITRTFPAAKLCIVFSTFPILVQNTKDKLPSSTTPMCIYRFDCSCGASYLGRTARHLSKRIAEHHPAWLGKGVVKSIRSSIVEHLVDTGHQVNVQNAFSVYYKIPANLPQSIKLRQLCIAEAVAIKKLKPALCVQKRFVRTLLLPWPEIWS